MLFSQWFIVELSFTLLMWQLHLNVSTELVWRATTVWYQSGFSIGKHCFPCTQFNLHLSLAVSCLWFSCWNCLREDLFHSLGKWCGWAEGVCVCRHRTENGNTKFTRVTFLESNEEISSSLSEALNRFPVPYFHLCAFRVQFHTLSQKIRFKKFRCGNKPSRFQTETFPS